MPPPPLSSDYLNGVDSDRALKFAVSLTLDFVYTIMYIYNMNFDWDNNKNQSNIAKHGISFEEAIAIFDDPNILNYEDTRFNYGETRFVSIGQIILVTQEKTVIIVVIHTQRNQTIRLISARKANERERKRYERQ